MTDEELLIGALDGRLSEEEGAALDLRLEAEPALAQRYLELAQDEALLTEVVLEGRARRSRSGPIWRILTVAAAGLILASVFFVLFSPNPQDRPLPARKTGLYRVAYSPSGNRIATVAGESIVKVWDVRNPRQKRLVRSIPIDGMIRSFAFTKDDYTLTLIWNSPNGERHFRPLDLATGEFQVRHAYGEEGPDDDRLLAFSADGLRAAVFRNDPTGPHLGVYSLESGIESTGRSGTDFLSRPVQAIAFDPAGSLLALALADGTETLLYHTREEKFLGTWKQDRAHAVVSMAFSPDGGLLAQGTADGAVLLWDLHPIKFFGDIPMGKKPVSAIAFSPDGRMLAAASESHVTQWRFEGEKRTSTTLNLPDAIRSMAFRPNGLELAVLCEDGTIRFPVAERERSANEESAIRSLKTIGMAETEFRLMDRDGNAINDYWTGDVAGLYAIGTDNPIKLVDLSIALADAAPTQDMKPFGVGAPKAGYRFLAMKSYQQDTDGSGRKVHHKTSFGFCAYPEEYGPSHALTLIIGQAKSVYARDIGGKPVDSWPTDEELTREWARID